MQILELKIVDYKCLLDFNVNFKPNESGSSTILIGENGSGKSTILEALFRIIASFDSSWIEKDNRFNFYIKYLYGGETFEIQRDDNNKYSIKNSSNTLNINNRTMRSVKMHLNKLQKKILPKRVLLSYSGVQDKFLDLYNSLNYWTYRNRCVKTITTYYEQITSKIIQTEIMPVFPDKQYNYCSEYLTPVFLASILLDHNNSNEKDLLEKSCDIEKVSRIEVELSLKKLKNIFHSKNNEYGNNSKVPEAFWSILNFIEPKLENIFKQGYLYKNHDKIYFSLNNFILLKNMDKLAIFNAFEKLQTLYSASFNVFIKYGKADVSYNNMSEGQRQLINILGMLGLYKNEDCLVLMDEPDAHMNPKWKYDMKSIIDSCLKGAVNTQALIATHDPLVLNGVDKDYIRIFKIENKNNYKITKVIVPDENTKGLGIDGLLQSEYYGLKTSYDKETSDKYQERKELYIKLVNNETTENDKNRLRELTAELGGLPFSDTNIDFLYDDFIKEYRNSELYYKEYLSAEEVKKRKKKIQNILTELFEKDN